MTTDMMRRSREERGAQGEEASFRCEAQSLQEDIFEYLTSCTSGTTIHGPDQQNPRSISKQPRFRGLSRDSTKDWSIREMSPLEERDL